MSEKVSIFINPTARKNFIQQAIKLSEQLPESKVHRLTHDMSDLPETAETVGVVGGDGSVRSVVDKLTTIDNPSLLLVFPGGSQNGFYRTLLNEGFTMNAAQLQNKETGHLTPFQPGVINGRVFAHFAGWGKLEQQYGIESETLHRMPFLPRESRMYLAGLMTLVKNLSFEKKLDPVIQLALTGSYLGPIKVLPNHKLCSDNLALLTVNGEGNATFKLIIILFYALMKKRPPEHIGEVKYSDIFEIANHGRIYTRVNTDGEIASIEPRGSIFLRRHGKSVQAAAFVGV